jgi:hypothetical protein
MQVCLGSHHHSQEEGQGITREFYLATEFLPANERGNRYPVDFDMNGHIRATRTPEDPAPLAFAHGLPLIYIAEGGIP